MRGFSRRPGPVRGGQSTVRGSKRSSFCVMLVVAFSRWPLPHGAGTVYASQLIGERAFRFLIGARHRHTAYVIV